jgi:hypothetical protein
VIGVAAFRERRREPIAYEPAPMIAPPMAGMEKSASDSAAGNAARAESSAPSAMGQSAPSAIGQQIGTGHGQRRYDPVAQTRFERDSTRPNQRIALFYDSREALVARGVINESRYYGQQPEPFPVGFVPDPR